jgi:hypothetical protein
MDLKNLTKIETEAQYKAVYERMDELINEATEKGLLESDYDNEYTREIGRLSRIGSIYEDEYMTFEHINSPLGVDADLLVEYA